MTNELKEWLGMLQPDAYPWMWQVFALLLATLLTTYLLSRFLDRLERRLELTHNLWDDALLAACRRPAMAMIWLWSLSLVLNVILLSTDAQVFSMIDSVRPLLVIVLLTWFLYSIVQEIETRIIGGNYNSERVDQSTARAISKLIRVAIVMTGALVGLQTMGYSVSGVLAFGGIGGIALGFAAKDLLANFFGGLMIYLDRPFSEGDWIRSPDKSIEGTVEHIGWRLTRIRTFDKRPLYVPNSVFTQISVENPSRMLNRRIYETIGLRYSDSQNLAVIIEAVKSYLKEHKDIDSNQTLIVNFNAFGGSSLDFFIYCFTHTVNWVEFHEIKQRVLLDILGIIHAQGGDVAFPTRTLHIEQGAQPPEATP